MKLSHIVFALLGLAAGWLATIAVHGSKASTATASMSGVMQCPMHPWIKSNHPGTCTVCGMELVSAASGKGHVEAGPVMLPPASVSVTGIQTALVKRAPLMRTLRFAGRFEEDAAAHAVISAPVEGRIDGLGLVHGNGIIVQRQPLATFFSKTLLAAAKEYKDALTNHDDAAVAAAKKKLEHYGLVQEQIQSIPSRQDNDIYFGILSPRSGSVVKSYCSEGQYVREGEKLFEITDLKKFWFMFSVFEQDLPLIQVGQFVDIESATLPPEKVKAQITFIDRNLDEATHSVHVRVDVENPKRLLRLNGDGICTVNLQAPEVLTVPRSAVLWPGKEPRVFVETQSGTYERRTVKLGQAGDCDWEVLAGLKEGEHVVTQGAMLIDGQAQWSAAP